MLESKLQHFFYSINSLQMERKVFSMLSSIAMKISLSVALLSLLGIPITGWYPGIAVLLFLVLIPMASRLYAKKITAKPNSFQKSYYIVCTGINGVLILMVSMMTFVILVDRVFPVILK